MELGSSFLESSKEESTSHRWMVTSGILLGTHRIYCYLNPRKLLPQIYTFKVIFLVELIYSFDGIKALVKDLWKTWLWTATWKITLKINKCFHLGPGSPRTLIMPASDRISSVLYQDRKTSELLTTFPITSPGSWISAESLLHVNHVKQCACSPNTEGFNSAFVCSQMKYCVQVCSPSPCDNVRKLEEL